MGRTDPHGREIARYWFSRPLWPRTAFGTGRNSRRKPERRNFPVLGALLGGIRLPTQFLLENPQLLCVQHFFCPHPHGQEIAKHWDWGCRPLWPTTPLTPGHLEKFRAENRAEWESLDFQRALRCATNRASRVVREEALLYFAPPPKKNPGGKRKKNTISRCQGSNGVSAKWERHAPFSSVLLLSLVWG